MGHFERRVREFGSLGLLLLVVSVLATGVITSCGGGSSGGSDGDLCSQCGDDPDGPCIPTIYIVPDANNDHVPECNGTVDPMTGTCPVNLICRRKVDSGQRRCFPQAKDSNPPDVDYQFRCDGSRPGGTPKPPTPTPLATTAPSTSAAPQTCGNGTREGTEVCDSPDLSDETCESQGCGGGILSCRVDCQGFNFSSCTGIGCASN